MRRLDRGPTRPAPVPGSLTGLVGVLALFVGALLALSYPWVALCAGLGAVVAAFALRVQSTVPRRPSRHAGRSPRARARDGRPGPRHDSRSGPGSRSRSH